MVGTEVERAAKKRKGELAKQVLEKKEAAAAKANEHQQQKKARAEETSLPTRAQNEPTNLRSPPIQNQPLSQSPVPTTLGGGSSGQPISKGAQVLSQSLKRNHSMKGNIDLARVTVVTLCPPED